MAATNKSKAQAAAKTRAKKASSTASGEEFSGVATVTVYVNDVPTVVYQGERNLYAQPDDDVRIELKVG